MATRASRIIRRVRDAEWARGLPLESMLPLAETIAGMLAGLLLGAGVWGAVKARLLDHRAIVLLSVNVDEASDEEGAAHVAAHVNGGDFQARWLKSAGDEGLARGGKLHARPIRAPGTDETQTERVMLTCEGRPGSACRGALIAARDMITAADESLGFSPRQREAEKRRLRGEIAGVEAAAAKAEGEAQRLRPGAREVREKGEADERVKKSEERVAAARAEYRKVSGNLEAMRKEKETALARLKASPSAVRLTKRQLKRYRRELEALAELLGSEAMADSTEKHPVRERMAAIRSELELAALPERIRALDLKLADAKKKEDRLRDEELALGTDRKKQAEVYDSYKEAAAKREKVGGLLERLARQKREKSAGLAALESLKKVAVRVTPAGEVEYEPPAFGWAFILVGMAFGMLVALLVHRKILPMLTVIDDEESMADKLQVPVLGVVPRLVMLERR